MRITALALSLAICLLLCSPTHLPAQRRGGGWGLKPGGGGSDQDKGPVYSHEFDQTPFDITRERLPRAYMGHNIQLVHNAVKNMLAERRGGQETGAEHLRGQGREDDPPLLAALNLNSIYAFQVKPAEVLYHSGEHTLEAYCELSPVLANGREDETRRGFRVIYAPQVDNRFTYTDDKGAQIEFEELKFREYTAAFRNFRDFPVEKAVLPSMNQAGKSSAGRGQENSLAREMIIGSFEVEPKAVKQLLESTRLLVVCNLADPYATSETVELHGTPEKPREYLAVHEYLQVRLLGLWFYDVVTGRILKKIGPAGAGKPSPGTSAPRGEDQKALP